MRLLGPHPTIFFAPAIICLVRDTQRAANLADATSLTRKYFCFAQFAYRSAASLHSLPHFCLFDPATFSLDRFSGGRSIDLFFRQVFVFFIIELGSRRVVHFGLTRSPTSGWRSNSARRHRSGGLQNTWSGITTTNMGVSLMKWLRVCGFPNGHRAPMRRANGFSLAYAGNA